MLEDASDFLCILFHCRDSSSSGIDHHSIVRLPPVAETGSSFVPLLISVLKIQTEITWQGGDNRGPDNSVSCILGERDEFGYRKTVLVCRRATGLDFAPIEGQIGQGPAERNGSWQLGQEIR